MTASVARMDDHWGDLRRFPAPPRTRFRGIRPHHGYP